MKQLGLKRIKSIMTYSVATIAALSLFHTAYAGTQKEQTDLVSDVIQSAEKSLPLVEKDTDAALKIVDQALATVKKLKMKVARDTHIESKSPLVLNESKEYWFLYPQVDKKILKDGNEFPVLSDKYQSGILYKGTNKDQFSNSSYAYFDHAFASASLLTAREALRAKEYKRAKIALKWVFEAVYVTPDFLVSMQSQTQQGDEQKIDSLININGEYPTFTEQSSTNKLASNL